MVPITSSIDFWSAVIQLVAFVSNFCDEFHPVFVVIEIAFGHDRIELCFSSFILRA